jgi:hypothetical protein
MVPPTSTHSSRILPPKSSALASSPWRVGVEQDQRMQVAVAGVEDVGHRKAELGAHLADALQHMRQGAARDGAVHAVVVGGEAAHSREGGLASGPEFEALFLALGGANLDRAGGFEHGAYGEDVVRDFLVDAIHLAQEQRLAVERIAGVDEGLGGLDGEPVHHFQTGGNDAGGNNVADRGAGVGDVIEACQHHLRPLRARQQLDRDFGDHRQHAFRAGQQSQQVVTRRIERIIADLEQFAGDGPGAQLEDVVHGEAVFQTVHAAGVLRHVAADRAGDLRGGVGRVIEIVLCDGFGNRQVANPGLDHCGARQRIDVLDAVEFGQNQQNRAVDRQCARGKSGAGAACHHRHLVLMAKSQDGRDLRFVLRNRHHVRGVAIGRQPVGLERQQVLAFMQHAMRGQLLAQFGEEGRSEHAGCACLFQAASLAGLDLACEGASRR